MSVDASSGYLQCASALPNILLDVTQVAQQGELHDGSGKLLALSNVASDTTTLDASGTPTAYGNLTFTDSTAAVGAKNDALITMNGVVSSVQVTQQAPLFEGTAATVGLTFQGVDVDGNVIAAPGLSADASGTQLRIGMAEESTINGDGTKNPYSIATSYPSSVQPHVTGNDLEPGCSTWLSYSGRHRMCGASFPAVGRNSTATCIA